MKKKIRPALAVVAVMLVLACSAVMLPSIYDISAAEYPSYLSGYEDTFAAEISADGMRYEGATVTECLQKAGNGAASLVVLRGMLTDEDIYNVSNRYKNSLVELEVSPFVKLKGGELPANAFRGYTSLKLVSMPSVTAVGNGAFAECASLEQVSMRLLERIDENAFFGCGSLKDMYFGERAPYVIADSAFDNTNDSKTLAVPTGSNRQDFDLVTVRYLFVPREIDYVAVARESIRFLSDQKDLSDESRMQVMAVAVKDYERLSQSEKLKLGKNERSLIENASESLVAYVKDELSALPDMNNVDVNTVARLELLRHTQDLCEYADVLGIDTTTAQMLMDKLYSIDFYEQELLSIENGEPSQNVSALAAASLISRATANKLYEEGVVQSPFIERVVPKVEQSAQTAPPANKPVTVPDKPVTVPDKPVTVPDKPATVPDKPVTVPDKPVTVPDKPASVPDKPASVPDKPMDSGTVSTPIVEESQASEPVASEDVVSGPIADAPTVEPDVKPPIANTQPVIPREQTGINIIILAVGGLVVFLMALIPPIAVYRFRLRRSA